MSPIKTPYENKPEDEHLDFGRGIRNAVMASLVLIALFLWWLIALFLRWLL
jgi:hypothetical protein